MEYPRIRVRNLGPIVDVDMAVNDFMVLIGPQASGKSTLSKIIYFFNAVPRLIHLFITAPLLHGKENFPEKVDFSDLERELLEYWFGMSSFWGEVDLLWTDNLFVKLLHGDFSFSDDFVKIVEKYNDEIKYSVSSSQRLAGWDGYDIINRRYRDFLAIFYGKEEVIIIPTDRSWTSEIVINREMSFEKDKYLRVINAMRGRKEHPYSKNVELVKLLDLLSQKILRGKLLPGPNGDKFVFQKTEGEVSDGGGVNIIELRQASSGQQDAAWMVEILRKVVLLGWQSVATIIEEPEGHLFPEGQKAMADLLGLFFNITNSRLVVTTHSPYMISALNNLIYAKDVHDAQGDQETGKIIDPKLWIDGNKVGAYLLNNGRAECVIDADLGLMDATPIHKIMDEIDGENDRLFHLEYGE